MLGVGVQFFGQGRPHWEGDVGERREWALLLWGQRRQQVWRPWVWSMPGIYEGPQGATTVKVTWTTMWVVGDELKEVTEDGTGCVEPVGSCKDCGFYSGYNKLLGSY